MFKNEYLDKRHLPSHYCKFLWISNDEKCLYICTYILHYAIKNVYKRDANQLVPDLGQHHISNVIIYKILSSYNWHRVIVSVS